MVDRRRAEKPSLIRLRYPRSVITIPSLRHLTIFPSLFPPASTSLPLLNAGCTSHAHTAVTRKRLSRYASRGWAVRPERERRPVRGESSVNSIPRASASFRLPFFACLSRCVLPRLAPGGQPSHSWSSLCYAPRRPRSPACRSDHTPPLPPPVFSASRGTRCGVMQCIPSAPPLSLHASLPILISYSSTSIATGLHALC